MVFRCGRCSYQPHITSYDYDSPVSEGGDHGYGPDGDKYDAVQVQKLRYLLVKLLFVHLFVRSCVCVCVCAYVRVWSTRVCPLQ